MFSVGPSNSYLALALHNFLTQTYESLPILWFFFNISVHGEGKAPYHDISSISQLSTDKDIHGPLRTMKNGSWLRTGKYLMRRDYSGG
jgi:hypothetical protein